MLDKWYHKAGSLLLTEGFHHRFDFPAFLLRWIRDIYSFVKIVVIPGIKVEINGINCFQKSEFSKVCNPGNIFQILPYSCGHMRSAYRSLVKKKGGALIFKSFFP